MLRKEVVGLNDGIADRGRKRGGVGVKRGKICSVKGALEAEFVVCTAE